jgi:hypothetical protein
MSIIIRLRTHGCSMAVTSSIVTSGRSDVTSISVYFGEYYDDNFCMINVSI